MKLKEQTIMSSLIWAGLMAPLFFVAVVAAGIAFTPGFNAVDQPISTLYASGAVNGRVFQVSFIVYNIFLLTFGMAVFLNARSTKGSKQFGMIAGFTLVLASIAGMIDDLNPQDRAGAISTSTGILHWQSTGIAFGLMVLSIFLVTVWIWRRSGLSGFVVYSLSTLVIVMVSGVLGGAAMSGFWPHMGIYETITMLFFQVWLVVLSIFLVRQCADGEGNTQNTNRRHL